MVECCESATGRAAKSIGVSEVLIQQLIDGLPGSDNLPLSASPNCVFTTRLEIGSETTAHRDFATAFAAVKIGYVIEWGCLRTSCVLDIDYPIPDLPDRLRYAAMVWASKTDDHWHAVYHHTAGYDAIELAAMDAYRIQLVYPDVKLELVSKTRMPPKGITASEQQPVQEFLEEHSAGTWLLDRGLKPGDRLPHTDCPVNPSPRSLGKVEPICLREHYVHCYICEADGIKRGSKNPGRFPYSVLSGDLRPTKLSILIDNMVHYGHGKYVMYTNGVGEPVARNLYSGLLKSKHGVDDPRIAACFVAGEPIGIVRYQGYWTDDSGTALVLDKSSPILKSLPASQKIDHKGNASPNATQLEWLSQPIDLGRIGYIPLAPLNGMQLTQFQSPEGRVFKLREGKNPPKYLPDTKRMEEEKSWEELEKVFPGLNRKAITALIVGRGCSEFRVGLPPMLFISGAAGTGKTATVSIAAAICGDSCTPVTLNRDTDRFNNEFMTAKSRSGFVLFDEFFKFAKQASMTDVEAMQHLLKYGGEGMAYKIYIGAVPMGDLPMMVWADTDIPPEVLQHEQIGRRVYNMWFGKTLSWEKPLADTGIYEPRKLRDNAWDELLVAINSILSRIIDRYFTGLPTDYTVCMDELGIKKMNQSEQIEIKNRLIRDLFETICSKPDIKEKSDLKRWSARGMKVAKDNDATLLAYELLQSEREKRTLMCRSLSETDIAKVIGSQHTILFQVQRHGAKYAMRFVSDDLKFVNKELIDAGN